MDQPRDRTGHMKSTPLETEAPMDSPLIQVSIGSQESLWRPQAAHTSGLSMTSEPETATRLGRCDAWNVA